MMRSTTCEAVRSSPKTVRTVSRTGSGSSSDAALRRPRISGRASSTLAKTRMSDSLPLPLGEGWGKGVPSGCLLARPLGRRGSGKLLPPSGRRPHPVELLFGARPASPRGRGAASILLEGMHERLEAPGLAFEHVVELV